MLGGGDERGGAQLALGIQSAVGKEAGQEGEDIPLPAHHLSLVLASSVRLEGPLVKSLRARRGQAHGPAGPRALYRSPPSSQTTMTWATTCGPICFKVRLKGKGGGGGAVSMCGPENTGDRRPLGCPPYLDLTAQMHNPTDTHFTSTPKASFMLSCPRRMPGPASSWQVCPHCAGDAAPLGSQAPTLDTSASLAYQGETWVPLT